MSLSSPFSRWLHKRLSHRYTNSGLATPYSVKLSTLQRDSGFLTNAKISRRVEEVERTLNELKAADVLMCWEKEERRAERNHLKDVLFTMTGSMTFTTEMKAMNARHRQIDGALRAKASEQLSRAQGNRR